MPRPSLKKWIGYARGWRDAVRAAFRVARSERINTSDAFMVYGGSALPTGVWFAKRLLAHPVGREMLLGARPVTAAVLGNMKRLAVCPPGSLGRVYHDTLTGPYRQGYDIALHDEAHKQAAPEVQDDIRAQETFGHPEQGGWTRPARGKARYLAQRLMGEIRWQHDLMHVLTGYQPDIAGELGLMAFTIPHIRLPAPKIMTLIWVLVRCCKKRRLYELHVVREAWRNGRNVNTWLLPVDWAAFIDRPLEDVRAAFGIKPPVLYHPMPSRRPGPAS